MTLEIISWSISTKVWDWAGIELATPGSAAIHASVARHVADCATRPSVYACLLRHWGHHSKSLSWPNIHFYKNIMKSVKGQTCYNTTIFFSKRAYNKWEECSYIKIIKHMTRVNNGYTFFILNLGLDIFYWVTGFHLRDKRYKLSNKLRPSSQKMCLWGLIPVKV